MDPTTIGRYAPSPGTHRHGDRVDASSVTASRSQSLPGDGAVLAVGQFAITLLFLVLSPLALMSLGWQYTDTGGSPIEKFHPATLLAILMLGWVALNYGNAFTGILDMLGRHARLLPYFAASIFMIGYTSQVFRLPVTIFVETFIGAGLMLILFTRGNERSKRAIALAIHAALMANVALAFYEQAAGWKLTPLVINGELLADEPRSTALLGHPLANAMLMACYIVMLALGGARDLPVWLRPVVFLAALASLVPFGGRAGTAACLLALAVIASGKVIDILRGATFDTRVVIAALIAVPVAATVMITAFETGALATLMDRIEDDTGSAATRIEMFQLFRYLSFDDWVFGSRPDVLATWVAIHGLDYGIESFIVAFVLNYGLLCTVVFMPAFVLFFRELILVTRTGAWLPVTVFIAVALTSLSLSSKTPALSIFVIFMCVLMRRDVNASHIFRSPRLRGDRGDGG